MTAPRPIEPALLARALSRSRRAVAGIGLLATVLVGAAVQWFASDLRRQPLEAAVSTAVSTALDGVRARALALPASAGGGLAGRVAPPGSPGQGPAFGSAQRDGRFPWSRWRRAAPPLAEVEDDPGPPAGVLLVPPDRREWRRSTPPTGPPHPA